jgi:hypothetical protein
LNSAATVGISLDFAARFIRWTRETCGSRETRLAGKRRLQDVPRALKEMGELLDQEMAVDRLDSYLARFFDYHQGDPEAAKLRPWNKTSLSVKDSPISPEQVIGMPLDELVAMMHISMETELPIHSYTIESGDALQFILASLARFMGITKKQAACSNGVRRCEAQWCAEEYRHAQLLRRLIRILTGREPESEKWADPTITKNDDESAFKHLSSRNYTETGAAGTYVFMASHTRDELRLALMNLVGDELKHLTVVAAADVYLRGKDANNRLLRMLEKGVAELQEAATVRTAGKKVYSNPINIFEAFMALSMIEVRMRRYLRNLPLKTLERIFDTPSRLPERLSFSTPREREENAHRIEENNRLRKELAHWPEHLRKAAFKQRRFEESHQELIRKIIESSSELDFCHEGLAELKGDREGQAHLKAALADAVVDRRIMIHSALYDEATPLLAQEGWTRRQ